MPLKKPSRKMILSVLNGLLFYLGWYAALVGAVQGQVALGVMVCVVFVAFHFIAYPNRKQECYLMLFVLASGGMLDTLYIRMGWLSYITPNLIFTEFVPIWVMAIYALFSTSINHSLGWLGKRWLLASVLGGSAGAFCYFVGAAAGAAEFHLPLWQIGVILFAIWAVYFPLVLVVRDFLWREIVLG